MQSFIKIASEAPGFLAASVCIQNIHGAWDTLHKVLWVLMQSRKELYKKQSIIKSHIYWNAMLPGYLRFDEPAIVIPSNLNKVKKYCTKAQSFVVLAFVQQESLTHHMGSTRLYIYSLRGVSHWKAY